MSAVQGWNFRTLSDLSRAIHLSTGVHPVPKTVEMREALAPVRFTFPRMPPSINSLYQIIYNERRVELKPDARRWKSEMKAYVPRFAIAESSLLRIDFIFHYPFEHANGNIRDFDSQNFMKLGIDCICEKVGIRDKRAKSGSWDSVDEENEFVEVVLTEILTN